MAKIRTSVFRSRHPSTVAQHHYKLSNRLRKCLGIRTSLTVDEHDQIDTCLGQSILEYLLVESEFTSRELQRELRALLASETALKAVLSYKGTKYDDVRILEQEMLRLISAELPGDFFRSYTGEPRQVELAHAACANVITALDKHKAKAGRKSNEWYDPFIYGMWLIAKWSKIGLSIQDRMGEKLRTPFLDLVGAYEMCLLKGMRSGSREARAKRIQVSLNRLKAQDKIGLAPDT